MGEQQDIADRWRIGEQHHQTIDTDTFAGGGRQAVFQGADVVGIEVHGFGIAGVLFLHLGEKALGLILGIVEQLGPNLFLSGYGIPSPNQLKDVIAFTVLVLVLIFRPSGLLGRKENT